MRDVAALLPRGVAARSDVADLSSAGSVGRWLRRGELVLVAPGVVALPDRATDWLVRAEAATLWAVGQLSHLSALAAAGLTPAVPGHAHVTVPINRCPRDVAGVVVHRSRRPLVTIMCHGIEVIEPTRSLVDAWSWANRTGDNQDGARERPVVRQAVIEAVRTRTVRPAALRRESDRRPRHSGRARLVELIELLAGGCESELEIWGVQRVLPGPPTVPQWVQQYRVTLAGGRHLRLDAAYPEARVDVELDGAAFHGSRQAREDDLRRDSALAMLGWVVLRFSYARLISDPDGCRREIEAVVRHRLAAR